MKFAIAPHLIAMLTFSLLAACGGGGGNDASSSIAPAAVEDIQIFGAGVKGPLAFADTRIFRLDTEFPDFYDPNSPVSSAITNEFAQISGLRIPGNIKPPFILTIGGDNAIDLNTGTTPVIHTLVTVITKEMLAGKRPIYATPLTTMAVKMARREAGASADPDMFLQQLDSAAVQVDSIFSIDQSIDIDIFRSPLVINSSTATVSGQELAVLHRAALEAFAAKVHMLSVAAGDISTDSIIDRLARDLQSDGVLDNADSGTTIGAIDLAILAEDAMKLVIPNTTYRISDVMELMEDERIQLGTAATGPVFHKDQIALPTTSTPAIVSNAFPVNLQGAVPEEATVVMNVNKPAGSGSAIITLSVFDADFPDEGELIINGNAPVALFGSTGTASNDKAVANIPINTPADYWNDGDNTLVFRHTSTSGYTVQSAAVSFQAAIPVVYEPVITLSTTSIAFGDEDVGGIAGPKVVMLTNNGNAPLTISGMSIPSGFSKTNDCNNYLPTNRTCTISISFTPTKTGNISGALVISGDSDIGTYRVNLSGTGRTGSTDVVAPSPGKVLQVNFDNHPMGKYTEQDAIDDFDADQSTGPGWSHHTNDTDVVADPAGDSGRGMVMRVTHLANKGGGGPRFKGRLPVADEYYLSYEIFIPKSNELMKQEKMPGLDYGSMLDSSHAYQEKPIPEGVKAFKARLQLLKPGVYQERGNTNQLTTYIYDADRVQYNRWFNLVDPVNSPVESTWSFPKGQWVKIELRVKQNTATAQEGVGDLKDGILQTWVDGKLAVDKQDMRWRTVNTMHIDGLNMYNYYGGNPTSPENQPSMTQYTYFDNFIVSTSPVTH